MAKLGGADCCEEGPREDAFSDTLARLMVQRDAASGKGERQSIFSCFPHFARVGVWRCDMTENCERISRKYPKLRAAKRKASLLFCGIAVSKKSFGSFTESSLLQSVGQVVHFGR